MTGILASWSSGLATEVTELHGVAHASRVLVSASRRNSLFWVSPAFCGLFATSGGKCPRVRRQAAGGSRLGRRGDRSPETRRAGAGGI
jgi:hypothetical protein